MPSLASLKFEVWNRRLHYYLGLYFLLFLWLFAFTGLLLNHSMWQFAQYWPERVETSREAEVTPVSASGDTERAHAYMQQLGVVGEIDWPAQPQAPGKLEFAVNRPGNLNRVAVDLESNQATVQNIRTNGWGIINALHTFSGIRFNNPDADRDWRLTSLWVLAMDALALGLLVMVFSSYYMWWRFKKNHLLGWLALGTGCAVCGFFVFGLSSIV